MSLTRYDEKIARSIQDEINCIGITENAIFPKEKEKENYRPRTLVDETLEYIDPTPNIYTLFVQFNEKFFWNVLIPVQVKWSPRMTSCAGTCTFHPRNKECIISLSNPLLKLRPRKDLIETLLHEMIHAYLFLTNNNRDRDGHGPVFKSHMKRINREAGTNITIYHSFHEEVRLYQQHWWRCNGPCQKRAPYFGTVRRAMNRAPGPNDFWWNEHMLSCKGQFIKIKEPQKNETLKKKKTVTKTSEKNNILKWVNKTDNKGRNTNDEHIPKISNQPKIIDWRNTKNNSVSNFQTDMKKLGNNTNNVHGWGTGGPDSTSNSSNSSTNNKITQNGSLKNNDSRLSFSGVLGGSGTGRSILLDKFSNEATTSTRSKKNSSIQITLNQTNVFQKPIKNSGINQYLENVEIVVTCPICNKSIDESKINQHLDICLENTEIPEITPESSNKKRKLEDDYASNKIFKNENKSVSKSIECPLCKKKVNPDNFNEHLDHCLQNNLDEKADDTSIHDSSSSSVNLHDSPHICLICDKLLEANTSLNDHLEECVASVFNDSTINDDNPCESTCNKKQVLEKFPCPVCMELIQESLMNDHLDVCLKKTE